MDLVATQLHGKDLTDIWDIPNPMKTLSTILVNENRGEPEARLLWASGKESLLACYHVGKEFFISFGLRHHILKADLHCSKKVWQISREKWASGKKSL